LPADTRSCRDPGAPTTVEYDTLEPIKEVDSGGPDSISEQQ
jgi:hypothetical protein